MEFGVLCPGRFLKTLLSTISVYHPFFSCTFVFVFVKFFSSLGYYISYICCTMGLPISDSQFLVSGFVFNYILICILNVLFILFKNCRAGKKLTISYPCVMLNVDVALNNTNDQYQVDVRMDIP